MSDAGHAAQEAGPAALTGAALIAQIRERHKKPRRLWRPIPRWGGDVVVGYAKISTKAIDASVTMAPLLGNALLLSDGCVEIFIRGENGKLKPVAEGDELPGPVRFDGRLAAMFELAGESPTEIVIAMYGDDAAIHQDARRLMAWQVGAGLDASGPEEVEDLAGEADAAT